MSNTTSQPNAVTRDEAAERLKVSKSTLDRLIANGELRAKRIGRRVVISDDEITRYLTD